MTKFWENWFGATPSKSIIPTALAALAFANDMQKARELALRNDPQYSNTADKAAALVAIKRQWVRDDSLQAQGAVLRALLDIDPVRGYHSYRDRQHAVLTFSITGNTTDPEEIAWCFHACINAAHIADKIKRKDAETFASMLITAQTQQRLAPWLAAQKAAESIQTLSLDDIHEREITDAYEKIVTNRKDNVPIRVAEQCFFELFQEKLAFERKQGNTALIALYAGKLVFAVNKLTQPYEALLQQYRVFLPEDKFSRSRHQKLLEQAYADYRWSILPSTRDAAAIKLITLDRIFQAYYGKSYCKPALQSQLSKRYVITDALAFPISTLWASACSDNTHDTRLFYKLYVESAADSICNTLLNQYLAYALQLYLSAKNDLELNRAIKIVFFRYRLCEGKHCLTPLHAQHLQTLRDKYPGLYIHYKAGSFELGLDHVTEHRIQDEVASMLQNTRQLIGQYRKQAGAGYDQYSIAQLLLIAQYTMSEIEALDEIDTRIEPNLEMRRQHLTRLQNTLATALSSRVVCSINKGMSPLTLLMESLNQQCYTERNGEIQTLFTNPLIVSRTTPELLTIPLSALETARRQALTAGLNVLPANYLLAAIAHVLQHGDDASVSAVANALAGNTISTDILHVFRAMSLSELQEILDTLTVTNIQNENTLVFKDALLALDEYTAHQGVALVEQISLSDNAKAAANFLLQVLNFPADHLALRTNFDDLFSRLSALFPEIIDQAANQEAVLAYLKLLIARHSHGIIKQIIALFACTPEAIPYLKILLSEKNWALIDASNLAYAKEVRDLITHIMMSNTCLLRDPFPTLTHVKGQPIAHYDHVLLHTHHLVNYLLTHADLAAAKEICQHLCKKMSDWAQHYTGNSEHTHAGLLVALAPLWVIEDVSNPIITMALKRLQFLLKNTDRITLSLLPAEQFTSDAYRMFTAENRNRAMADDQALLSCLTRYVNKDITDADNDRSMTVLNGFFQCIKGSTHENLVFRFGTDYERATTLLQRLEAIWRQLSSFPERALEHALQQLHVLLAYAHQQADLLDYITNALLEKMLDYPGNDSPQFNYYFNICNFSSAQANFSIKDRLQKMRHDKLALQLVQKLYFTSFSDLDQMLNLFFTDSNHADFIQRLLTDDILCLTLLGHFDKLSSCTLHGFDESFTTQWKPNVDFFYHWVQQKYDTLIFARPQQNELTAWAVTAIIHPETATEMELRYTTLHEHHTRKLTAVSNTRELTDLINAPNSRRIINAFTQFIESTQQTAYSSITAWAHGFWPSVNEALDTRKLSALKLTSSLTHFVETETTRIANFNSLHQKFNQRWEITCNQLPQTERDTLIQQLFETNSGLFNTHTQLALTVNECALADEFVATINSLVRHRCFGKEILNIDEAHALRRLVDLIPSYYYRDLQLRYHPLHDELSDLIDLSAFTEDGESSYVEIINALLKCTDLQPSWKHLTTCVSVLHEKLSLSLLAHLSPHRRSELEILLERFVKYTGTYRMTVSDNVVSLTAFFDHPELRRRRRLSEIPEADLYRQACTLVRGLWQRYVTINTLNEDFVSLRTATLALAEDPTASVVLQATPLLNVRAHIAPLDILFLRCILDETLSKIVDRNSPFAVRIKTLARVLSSHKVEPNDINTLLQINQQINATRIVKNEAVSTAVIVPTALPSSNDASWWNVASDVGSAVANTLWRFVPKR